MIPMQYPESIMATEAGRMIVAVLSAAFILSMSLTSIKMFFSTKLIRGSIVGAVTVALFIALSVSGVFEPLSSLDLSWIRMPS